MVTFDIQRATLSDEEVTKLKERYPRLDLDPEKYCPTCKKTEFYTWRGETVKCDCRLQLALHKHYLAAGIDLDYQRLDWNDYKLNDIVLIGQLGKYREFHDRYVDRGMGLWFSGPRGVGKTMLASLVLKEFVKNGYTCFFSTFDNMIDAFTAGWYSDDERRYFQRKFVYSDVLLLDDVGQERRLRNNLPESTFDTILRSRVRGGRPTFLTTNLTPDDLETGYGSAVLSLLLEKSLYYNFTGDDYRPTVNRRTRDEIKLGETRPIF